MESIVLTWRLCRFIFFLNLMLGIWSMIPSPGERTIVKLSGDELQDGSSPRSRRRQSKATEMSGAVRPSATPFTPRTLAFNTLDRQLPLRSEGSGRSA